MPGAETGEEGAERGEGEPRSGGSPEIRESLGSGGSVDASSIRGGREITETRGSTRQLRWRRRPQSSLKRVPRGVLRGARRDALQAVA